jgi:hypothetical protein
MCDKILIKGKKADRVIPHQINTEDIPNPTPSELNDFC